MASVKKKSKYKVEKLTKGNFGDLLIESASEAVKYTKGIGSLSQKRVSLIEEPVSYSKSKIKRIRLKLGVSQSIFAKIFGESISAIQKWEQGNRNMSGSATRLLSMLDKDPDTVFSLIVNEKT